MPKYQVEILLAAWQDIDRISDFHLKMVGAASAEKITDHILDTLAKLALFRTWARSTLTRSWPGWNIARSFAEIMSAFTK